MEADERGYRVALLADELVNGSETPPVLDALGVLERAGWGVILLPPAWYPEEVAAPLLEQIAEHVDEFASHGYDVVVVGARHGLAESLATMRAARLGLAESPAMGAAAPDAVTPGSDEELAAFLAGRPRVTR